MKRLFIAADIHGFYPVWRKIINSLTPEDGIVLAGDLFDTVYGEKNHPDYLPELILTEFERLDNPKYYVYGNCDTPSFYQGWDYQLEFMAFGKNVLLNHGHLKLEDLRDIDLVIEGHTHKRKFKLEKSTYHLNPGSPTFPKDQIASFAVWEKHGVSFVDVETNAIFLKCVFDA